MNLETQQSKLWASEVLEHTAGYFYSMREKTTHFPSSERGPRIGT